MKKLIALALTLAAVHGAFAQGTVQFQNTALSAINTNNGTLSGRVQTGMFTGGITASLYWGTTSDVLTANNGTGGTLAGSVSFNPTSNGILAGNGLFVVNGVPAGSSAFFQVRVSGVDSTGLAWYGASDILQFTTGAAQGPATVLFGSSATSGVFHSFAITPIPEPSTIALAGLGAASLLLFRRRK